MKAIRLAIVTWMLMVGILFTTNLDPVVSQETAVNWNSLKGENPLGQWLVVEGYKTWGW